MTALVQVALAETVAEGEEIESILREAGLDDVKEIKDSLGGTVNDVVLGIVTLALRRHLERRGEDVSGLALKVFVPEDQLDAAREAIESMTEPDDPIADA